MVATIMDQRRINECEKAFWQKTLDIANECLDLDRSFLGSLERKAMAGGDPMEPSLWENFIAARRSLVEYTTENLNLLAQDKESQQRNKDVMNRLETALGEVMHLEEKLTGFLSENLNALKDTIDGLTKNQAIFTAYGRQAAKPRPEALETTA